MAFKSTVSSLQSTTRNLKVPLARPKVPPQQHPLKLKRSRNRNSKLSAENGSRKRKNTKHCWRHWK